MATLAARGVSPDEVFAAVAEEVGVLLDVTGRLAGRPSRGRRARARSRGIGELTALVATATSNVQARSDVAASRARIVAATDDERPSTRSSR